MVVCVTQMWVSMPVMMTDSGALEPAPPPAPPNSWDARRDATSGTSMENAVLSMTLTAVFCSPNRLDTSGTVSPSLAAFCVVAMMGMLRMDAAERGQ